MRPIPNLATESKPAAFVFGYMHGHTSQDGIVRRYWPEGSGAKLDPVGPSPLLIHLDQLRRVTPRYLNFSFGLRSNSDAERVTQGIRTRTRAQIQTQTRTRTLTLTLTLRSRSRSRTRTRTRTRAPLPALGAGQEEAQAAHGTFHHGRRARVQPAAPRRRGDARTPLRLQLRG